MNNDLIQYLYDNNFKNQLSLLEKDLKGKTIVVYGAGQFFQLINEYYNLSKFNIIGIADKKFTEDDKSFLGYTVVQISDIPKLNPDYVLVAIYNYLNVINILETQTFDNCKFKILPMIKKQYLKYTFLPEYLRNLIYLKEFFKSLFLYRNKKIHLQKLQIWTGQACTLRCKNCSQLFPYIKQHLYNIDKVIEDTKKVLQHCEVESLHIIGGEPFLNKNIDKLIEFVAQVNPNSDNKIISNGTIIPREEVLLMLQKYRDNICITVSQYDCVTEKQKAFKETMDKYGIKCRIISSELPWYYCGDNRQPEITGSEMLLKNFEACWDRTCYTIADGKLSICPRMHNSPMVFKEKTPVIEHLPIKILGKSFISRALIATSLTNVTYREACRHCYGVSNINNKYCIRGEQLEKD